ncbi:MAG: carboxypeptidase-like regulatory domain-containing protein [Niameybacter sp.]|uniref:carboxypeptidase-like regulatory domain-containing protein n=1 Tax=Niameybacter sp. TaxID=2033640 RepID=UPI002FCC6D0C
MKKFNQVLTLALASLLLAQPVLATPVKVEQSQEVKVEQPGAVTLPEVKKPEKTFQVKPVVVGGVSYVSVKDLEKYAGVKSEKYHQPTNGVMMYTPVSAIQISNQPARPQVNRQYIPCNYGVKLFNGVPHVPAKFTFENMNCTVAYDTKTKLMTVKYFGEPQPKLVDTQLNTIKGYVKNADGTPVVGAEVRMGAMKEDGTGRSTNAGGDNPNLPPMTKTDENGYYEFVGLDTAKYSRVQVGVNYTKTVGGKVVKFEGHTPGTFSKTKGALEDGFLRVDSRLAEMPVIYTYENIWD